MKDADFRSFINGERQKLLHYVRTFFKETAEMDAEDILQDVLLKLLERPTDAPLSSVSGYVYRSLKNRVIDSSRTKKSTISLDDELDGDIRLADVLPDNAPSALDLMQSEQGKRALFDALSELNEMERRVIVAHEFEGLSFGELSTRWKVPQNTLLSHKSRGLKKLKEYFSRSK